MIRKLFLTAIILFGVLLLPGAARAQVDILLDNLKNVVPPSPNASSIAKFSEWPVNLNTGVPDISIPIYELKGRSITVPISINYHAAGIRVGEIASWVGLGWALNVGGCISRSVQGLPDEDGYLSTSSNYTNPNNTCGSGVINQSLVQTTENQAAQGQTDTEMDIYNLSALGKSYRIYINAANDSAYTMPRSNIRITADFLQNNGYTWSMILEDGTKLLFGGNSSFVETTTNSSMSSGVGSFISAWYLQSIVTPTGEMITFTYTSNGISQPTHTSQSDWIQYWTGGHGGVNQGFTNSASTMSLSSFNTVTQLSLSTIESDLARVYFIPADTLRRDLNGGVALSEIKVLSKINNKYIEDWLFGYTYSQAAASTPTTTVVYNNNRLKLMTLTQKPTDGTPSQLWSFTYNPTSLPSQISYAQDYWGFYNGATNNSSMLPNIPLNASNCTIYPSSYTGSFVNGLTLSSFTGTGFMSPSHDIGNNRTPNPAYMQAEMLTKITYPTGGYSVFTYEPNSQPATVPVVTNNTSINLSLNLTATSNPYNQSQSSQFTLSAPGYVNLYVSSTISSGVYVDFPGASVTAKITDASGNIVMSNSSGNFNQWINLFLAGTYTLTLSTNVPQSDLSGTNAVNASATMTYSAAAGTQTIAQLLGGLRIKSIQMVDGVSGTPTESRYFAYAAPTVVNPLDSINDFTTVQYSVVTDPSSGQTNYYTKLTRTTSSKCELGAIQGGTVAYGQVTTYHGYNGADGYTVSNFSAPIPVSAASTNFPFLPTDGRSWRGGLLTSEQTFNAAGKVLKSTANSYQFVPAFSISNFKCGWLTIYTGEQNQNVVNSGLSCPCYSFTNEQVEHTSTTEVTYNVNTGDSLSATKTFYYDDAANMQPTRTVTFNSKGDSVVVFTRTALEEPAINSSIPLSTAAIAAIDTMLNRNMVGIPVETEKYTKSIVTNKTLTNYKFESNGHVQPDNVMVQNASNALETRVYFPRYDTRGNLLEQQKSANVKQDYIWDYAGFYPIAEVVGADSNSVGYTSFEADGSGNWSIVSSARDSVTPAITGYKSYNLSNGTISSTMPLSSTRTYTVSYWSTNGSYTLTNGGTPKQGKTINISGTSWTYYEHTITGTTTIAISGSGKIDELRLYLTGAQMTTFTYTPLVGVSSQCDLNNRITYFQYDGFNRLYIVKDQDGNTLKKYCYGYSGQSIACSQFYNNAKSGTYTRNNCGANYTGSTVTYTVAAGKYASLVSQGNADTLALNDVAANGQNYANTNGVCTPIMITINSINYVGITGFTATFVNTSTNQQTVFNIPAAGGTLGSLIQGTYNVTLAKSGTTKYLYTVCSVGHAGAVSSTFSNVAINSTCATVQIDTVN